MRAEIVISAQRQLILRRDSSFCAKFVRYNIFANGAPYLWVEHALPNNWTKFHSQAVWYTGLYWTRR